LSFQVETVEGFRDLHIPSGTQPGENLKFSQLGVPDISRPNIRGDHYFVIKVKIPKNIRFELPALSNSIYGKIFCLHFTP
jgi:DnaJ-class molecular chaperone